MQKTTEHYELLYLLAGNIPENEHEIVQTRLQTLLESFQAVITSQGTLGKRKLAYPIGNYKQGFYYWLEFDLIPSQLPPFEKQLKLDRAIVRFLTIKKKFVSAEEKAKREARLKNYIKEADSKPAVVKEEPVVHEKPQAAKISLEDLDKKLDEILEDNVF